MLSIVHKDENYTSSNSNKVVYMKRVGYQRWEVAFILLGTITFAKMVAEFLTWAMLNAADFVTFIFSKIV